MSELPNMDSFEEIKPGMKFTGEIDGSFSGGHLITVGVRNSPTLSGVAFTSNQPEQIERDVNENVPIIPTNTSPLQNTVNPKSWIDINIDKIPPGFEVEHALVSEYSNINKFVPVVLKPVNASTRVPINQTKSRGKGKSVSKANCSNPTGRGIKIMDSFLPRNYPSPAITNLPPTDHAEPNSPFLPSKKSRHMQDNN